MYSSASAILGVSCSAIVVLPRRRCTTDTRVYRGGTSTIAVTSLHEQRGSRSRSTYSRNPGEREQAMPTCKHGTCPNQQANHKRELCDKHHQAAVRDGRYGWTTPDRALKRIQFLTMFYGCNPNGLGVAAGISPHTIRTIGRFPKVRRDVEAAILSVPIVMHEARPEPVSSAGLKRRINALAHRGWGRREIGALIHTEPTALNAAIRCGKASAELHRRVAELYVELLKPGFEYGPNGVAMRLAVSRGWDTDVAWDDDTIDDPEAHPNYTGYDEMTVRRLLAGQLAESTRAAHLAGERPEWTAIDLNEAVRRSPAVSGTVLVKLTGAKSWMIHAAITANRSKNAPPRVRFIITESPQRVRELYES